MKGKWLPPLGIPTFKDRPIPKRVWLRIEDEWGDPLDFTATRLNRKGPTVPDGIELTHSTFCIDNQGPETAEMSVIFKSYRQIVRIFTDNGHRLNACKLTDAIPILEDAVKYVKSSDHSFYDQETHSTLKDTVNTFLAMCYIAKEHWEILDIDEPSIRIASRFTGE